MADGETIPAAAEQGMTVTAAENAGGIFPGENVLRRIPAEESPTGCLMTAAAEKREPAAEKKSPAVIRSPVTVSRMKERAAISV